MIAIKSEISISKRIDTWECLYYLSRVMLHYQILDSQSCSILLFDSWKSNVFSFKLKKTAQIWESNSRTTVHYSVWVFLIYIFNTTPWPFTGLLDNATDLTMGTLSTDLVNNVDDCQPHNYVLKYISYFISIA